MKILFDIVLASLFGYLLFRSYPFLVFFLRRGKSKIKYWRDQKIIPDQWPEALLLMSSALKVGLSLEESFHIMVHESPEPLRATLKKRFPEKDTWIPLWERAERIFTEPFLFVLKKSFILAAQTGASYAPLLESQAKVLRKRQILVRKIKALTAQSQMTAWIVGLSPIGLGLVLGLCAPEFIQPFFDSSLGWLCLAGALSLNSIGFIVIRQMLKIDD